MVGMSFINPSETHTRTFCQTVKKANKIRVDCYYPVNLQRNLTNFCVAQVEPDNSTTLLAYCQWTNKTRDCMLEEGYELKGSVGYSVHLQLPSNATGSRFRCTIVPPLDDTVAEECKLEFEDDDAADNDGERTPTTASWKEGNRLSVHEPAVNETKSESNSACSPTFLYLFVASVVVIVALLAFLVYRKIAGRRSSKGQKHNVVNGKGHLPERMGKDTVPILPV